MRLERVIERVIEKHHHNFRKVVEEEALCGFSFQRSG